MRILKFLDLEGLDNEYKKFIEKTGESIIKSDNIGEYCEMINSEEKVDVSFYFLDGGNIDFYLSHFDFQKYMPYTAASYYFDLAKYYQKLYVGDK